MVERELINTDTISRELTADITDDIMTLDGKLGRTRINTLAWDQMQHHELVKLFTQWPVYMNADFTN